MARIGTKCHFPQNDALGSDDIFSLPSFRYPLPYPAYEGISAIIPRIVMRDVHSGTQAERPADSRG